MSARPRDPLRIIQERTREVRNLLSRLTDVAGKMAERLTQLEVRVDDLERAQRVPRTRDEMFNSKLTGWPKGEPPRYNGTGTPCNMWDGPCCCGAWHHEGK